MFKANITINGKHAEMETMGLPTFDAVDILRDMANKLERQVGDQFVEDLLITHRMIDKPKQIPNNK